MPQVFISLRFGEAFKQGETIKKELEKVGITCFLCAVHEGYSITKAVFTNLVKAELVVILGTATYGKETDSSCSTHQELMYVMDKKKPFFLIKMCDKYEEAAADFYFPSNVAYYPWMPKEHGVLPKELIPRIIEKLNKVSQTPSIASPVLKEPPPPDPVKELDEAVAKDNMSKIVDILKRYGAVDQVVAKKGCEEICALAAKNDTNKIKLGEIGGNEVVVDALRVWGKIEKDVAYTGCGAIHMLAANSDTNKKHLEKLGAREIVKNVLKNDFKKVAIDNLK